MVETADCVVIGAGVVGLACAAALARAGREVLVLEALDRVGTQTSSRNSEVIHAGIYYPAGSLKARLCREGRLRVYDYCRARGVPHRRIGKLIVAATAAQEVRLQAIERMASANHVDDLAWIDGAELRRLEPSVEGYGALLSPSTGIIDSHALMLALEGDLGNAGGMVILRAPVGGGALVDGRIVLRVGGAEPMALAARTVVNAAGLAAQTVAASIAGVRHGAAPPQFLAVGHYYRLTGPAPFRHLVYPVPDVGGLGVHLTLDLGGQAKFGPDVRWIDRLDYRFDDSRFDAFVAAIRRYYPGLDPSRLAPDYTGVRPKIVGPGAPDADFRIDGDDVHGVPGLVNLFGIESPGLTAALAIGDHVVARLSREN